jgi:hypothetical protein
MRTFATADGVQSLTLPNMRDSLSKKNKGKQIHRRTADRLLRDFLERVKQVNCNEGFAFFVEEVRLFGSYLHDREMVGDVDLAFSMMRKTIGKLKSRCAQLEKDTGRRLSQKRLYEMSMEEVVRFLQSRSRWLDFAAIENVNQQGFPNKVIYEIPERLRLLKTIQRNEQTANVAHLHRIIASSDVNDFEAD